MLNEDKFRLTSAILSVFPTVQTIIEFSEIKDNSHIIRSIVTFAGSKRLIPAPSENLLIDLITSQAKNPMGIDLETPINSFEEFLEKKDELLKVSLSMRVLTERINALITDCKLNLPKVTNSMLTRLKKEPADTLHKQNVLRSLAFWIGYERPETGSHWNYATLLKLCASNTKVIHHEAGVRIGFALHGRGDMIDNETVVWMKKEVKEYVDSSMTHLTGRWGKVKSYDVATFYVDIPNESEFNAPSSYQRCMKIAVTLSHQISIRWALSEYFSPNRLLTIGIAVGSPTDLDNYLPPLLNTRLPGDPIIRFTDFARKCILINDIRIILSDRSHEISLYSGEILPIWWLEGFWSNLYFDFIPDLLSDKRLQALPEEIGELIHLHYLPSESEVQHIYSTQSSALNTFLHAPHNSSLGIEISKVLYYRQRYWDALDILRFILSLDPFHLCARNMRMLIYRELALKAPTFDISDNYFTQAEKEARFIQNQCACFSEDFYCEYAANYIARALSAIRYTRNQTGFTDEELTQYIAAISNWIDTAISILHDAVTVSASYPRSLYLLQNTKILKRLFNNEPTKFVTTHPIRLEPQVIKKPDLNIQWSMTPQLRDLLQKNHIDFIEKMFMTSFKKYDNSTALQTYRPTIYFSMAVVLWEYFPARTVANVKRALSLLNKAIRIAEAVKEKGVCIYSFTRMYGEIMPVPEFIAHIQAAIHTIKNAIKDDAELAGKDDAVIETDTTSSLVVMMLNL